MSGAAVCWGKKRNGHIKQKAINSANFTSIKTQLISKILITLLLWVFFRYSNVCILLFVSAETVTYPSTDFNCQEKPE